MDQIEQLPAETAPNAMTAGQPAMTNGRQKIGWRGGAALAALGLAGGALTVAARGGFARNRRSPPSLAPADRTLAWASPAVLGDSPKRRFYCGSNLAQAVTIEDLRSIAHRRLPGFVIEYLEGGSEDEAALSRNVAALAECHFLHRSMVDVSRRDVSTILFDRKMTIPVAIAPTGFNGLFWPHADLRLAEAAAEFGVPFAQSTMSNDLMSRVARVPGLRYWWQLYLFGPPEVRNTLISRARDNGCEALIVTVDAQIYGNREWEHRTMAGPASLGWSARFDALMHPRWFTAGILTHGMPRFENVIDFVPNGRRGLFQSAHWIRAQMDRAMTWDTVARIRDSWPRKLIIKGLLTVEDCVKAAEIGVDAVAISNHGGRQLDWAVAPLDLLPAVRQAVGGRITVLIDGAMRRGTDVIKALALGADAVFAGRAVLYGVAAGGKEGGRRALDILREELLRDLGLLGVPSIAELSPRLLVRSKQLCEGDGGLH
jgi:(S)-mandelate dehydrogenase